MKKGIKTIIVSSNYAWTIYNFRMPLIRRLKKEGYRVVVLTQFDGYEIYVGREVDVVKPLFLSRKGVNPSVDFLSFVDLLRNYLIIRPDCVLLFSIKPVIYGSAAAKLFRVPVIPMITGLGTAFISESWVTKVVKRLYRFALSSASIVFFQNIDDKRLFLESRLVSPDVCRMSPGSGVDVARFALTDVKDSTDMTFLLIARMLWDKGIAEFIAAARIVRERYSHAHFQLLGPLGVENRTAISEAQVQAWCDEGIIEYLGETDDVSAFIAEAGCVVLPSYREGTPRVLLEASAMGRPIITTDVPGCREVVEDGVTGLLCRSRDSIDLSAKMEQMLLFSHQDRQVMGLKGRQRIEEQFHHDIVNDLYVDAISECLATNIAL